MKLTKTIPILLAVAITTSVLAQEKKPVTIVMSGSYPPWNNTAPSGEYVGFEPEMIAEMCKRMARECEIKTIFWKKLIPSVRFGKYDVGISGVATNKYLKERVVSSDPYGKKGAVFVTKKSTLVASQLCEGDLRSVCGKDFDISEVTSQEQAQLDKMASVLVENGKVGVEGSSGREWLLKNLMKKVRLDKFSSANHLLENLQLGKEDTIMIGAETWTARSKQPEFQGYTQVGPVFYGGDLGSDVTAIAHPDHKDFITDMNKVIAEMKADGTMRELSIKWFGRDITQ